MGGDLAPKLAGGQETHGAPPGYHTLLAPLLMFPMTPDAAGRGGRRLDALAPSRACGSPWPG